LFFFLTKISFIFHPVSDTLLCSTITGLCSSTGLKLNCLSLSGLLGNLSLGVVREGHTCHMHLISTELSASFFHLQIFSIKDCWYPPDCLFTRLLSGSVGHLLSFQLFICQFPVWVYVSWATCRFFWLHVKLFSSRHIIQLLVMFFTPAA